jgi:hypothetical protein
VFKSRVVDWIDACDCRCALAVATRGSGLRMSVLGLAGEPRPQNALFCAAARRAAEGASPAAALSTQAGCDTCSTLNVSRRKSVQPRVQQVTERAGRVDSAGGSHARQLRRRRGLSCRAKHRVDAMSAPANCAGATCQSSMRSTETPHVRRMAHPQRQRARQLR